VVVLTAKFGSMSQLIADNKDVACYFTTKHSWRGR